ncbi:MAG: hypothetical protein RR356_02680 [Bacteroidales bacterium]
MSFYRKVIIYNKENGNKLELNERQVKAVLYAKENGKITNKEHQEINKISERTSSRDLEDLIDKEIFTRKDDGKNTYYQI